MAQRGYLGKISAIVAINTSSVKPSLDSSAKDINAWAKSTQSRISGAANSAGRALEGIFTPLQRLQAAIKNANRNPLDLKIQNPGAYLQLAKATEQIAKPLGQVQSQFAGLANSVQAELLPVLQSAQKQTTSLFNAISSGAKVSDRDIENTTARVERLNQAIRRASEASSLTSGLATGQELRFQAPEFISQVRRSSELQQQAAALTPSQLAGSSVVDLIGQQRAAANEAERLLANLDKVRTTRSGDAQAAEAAYSAQLAALGQINSRLELQVELIQRSAREQKEISDNIGAATQRASTTDATGRSIADRIRDIAALRQAEESLRREREIAANIGASTQIASTTDATGRSIAQRIQDISALRQAEESLRREREIAANVGAATQIASTTDATGRSIADRIRDIAALRQAEESLRREREIAANVGASTQLASTTDATGRSVADRIRDIAALRQAEESLRREREIAANIGASTQLASTADATGRSIADRIRDISALRQAEESLRREREIAANIGASTQIASTTDATGRSIAQRIQDINALRQAEESLRREREIAANIGASTQIASTTDATGRSIAQRIQDINALRQAEESLRREREIAANIGASTQIASTTDATGRSIAQRLRDIDNERRARQNQQIQREEQLLGRNLGAASDVAAGQANARRDAALAELGAPLQAASRQLSQLGSGITAVKGQLDSLPASIRTSFIPAITAAETEFARLSALGPAATAEQIENARIEVERLTASASRASSVIASLGGSGVGGIVAGLDGRVVQGFTSQLQVLQGVIAGVSGTARNDLAAAFDSVRTSIVNAERDGTIAARATQESIDASIQSLARLAATASNQNVGRVLTQIARAGDIGRRGLDRFALAAQQAGFAIDDFFSVTGGFDQRIRAVSNNITQLAFIIGSTKGLFIGLSVVIGTQVVLAISKWINSGRTAEDRSKALNDTLARQKNLVEALAESFRSLGDALTQGTLSNQASDARDFAESLNKARRARKDLNDEAVLQNDPVVRRERANQARIERELQNAGDQGTVVQLQAQLEESRRRERARRGVLVQPAPDANEVEGVLRRRAPNPFRQNVPNLPEGGGLSALRERRAALEGPLERLRQIIAEGPSFFDGGARFNIASESFDQLNSLAARLDSAISNAVDGIADDLANSARGPAATIRNAQQEVADAIEAGVPGARRLGVLVDQVGNEFRDAIQALEAAVQIADPAERERAIADARTRLDRVRDRRSDIEARTDAVRRERTLNPEFQFEAVLARAQSEIDRIGAPAQGFQRQLRELQFQRDSVRAQLEAAPADPVLARAEQELTRALISLEQAVSDLSFEATEASRLRGDPERGRTLSMTDAQRAAEEMQQGLNDIAARFGQVAENTTGLVDTQGMQEAQARFMEDQRRQLAPAVFALQDAVQNAILQGPSRAALNAADVTTMEGSRELNRLLRGDDPARDVNLLELQKQSQLLEDALTEQRKIAERLGGVVV